MTSWPEDAGALAPWLDAATCPPTPPPRGLWEARTRALHDAVDAAADADGRWLHPEGDTVQQDLGSHDTVEAWQEAKAAFLFGAEGCWSSLEPLYARYGAPQTRALVGALAEAYGGVGAVVTDSGMSAMGLLADALVTPGAHVVVVGEVYNKTRSLLRWAAERVGGAFDEVADADALPAALRPATRLVMGELVSNPLGEVLDAVAVLAAVRASSPDARVVVDDTLVTPWGARTPLLDLGVDVVTGSLTKALSGDDRTLGGYVVSRRSELLNRVMDLQALRGGVLDRRRAGAVAAGLEPARARFARRCASANLLARWLAAHPRVERVHHPSTTGGALAEALLVAAPMPGSVVSFRVRDLDDAGHRALADRIGGQGLVRVALSFDGLVTKVNHHRTVSEYFTAPAELRRRGLDRLVRLGVGVEDPATVAAVIGWALAVG